MTVHDVVVIGAGPAGIAAAVQLKRNGLEPMLLEARAVGGLLRNANLVENYLGIPEGITGMQLAQRFEAQLGQIGVTVTKRTVEKLCVTPDGDAIGIAFEHDSEPGGVRGGLSPPIPIIFAHDVIVATGTLPKKAHIKGEDALAGRKLFYEINELPAIDRPHSIAIIGGGDVAFDYALNLARRVRHVDILIRRSSPKCLPLLEARVRTTDNIELHTNATVSSLRETTKRVTLDCTVRGKGESLQCDYVLVAVGRVPNDKILPRRRDSDEIIVPEHVYLVGDIKRGSFRQVGIAVGDGLLAAMQIIGEE